MTATLGTSGSSNTVSHDVAGTAGMAAIFAIPFTACLMLASYVSKDHWLEDGYSESTQVAYVLTLLAIYALIATATFVILTSVIWAYHRWAKQAPVPFARCAESESIFYFGIGAAASMMNHGWAFAVVSGLIMVCGGIVRYREVTIRRARRGTTSR